MKRTRQLAPTKSGLSEESSEDQERDKDASSPSHLNAAAFVVVLPVLIAIMGVVVIWPFFKALHIRSNLSRTDGWITSHTAYPGTYRGMPKYEVQYAYDISGDAFESSRVSILPGSMTATEWSQLPAKFPVGSSVNVYYLPSDPTQACLDTDIPAVYYAATAVTGLLAIGYVLVMFTHFRYGCPGKTST